MFQAFLRHRPQLFPDRFMSFCRRIHAVILNQIPDADVVRHDFFHLHADETPFTAEFDDVLTDLLGDSGHPFRLDQHTGHIIQCHQFFKFEHIQGLQTFLQRCLVSFQRMQRLIGPS